MIKLNNREVNYPAHAHRVLTRRGGTYTQVWLQGIQSVLYHVAEISTCYRSLKKRGHQWGQRNLRKLHVQLLSCIQLFVTPWAVARQAPLSMGVLQAKILEWVAMPSSSGIFPVQELNPGLLHCTQILYHLSHQGRLLRRWIKENSQFALERSPQEGNSYPLQYYCLENFMDRGA